MTQSAGAQFDARGHLRNWWSDAELKQFKAAGEALAKQFDGYKPFPDLGVNPEKDRAGTARRIYVLGPPRDEKMLGKTSSESHPETYGVAEADVAINVAVELGDELAPIQLNALNTLFGGNSLFGGNRTAVLQRLLLSARDHRPRVVAATHTAFIDGASELAHDRMISLAG